MNVGKTFRHGFEVMTQQMGSTIIVHKNWDTPTASTFEVRGLKNNKKDKPSEVMFQFLEDPGVSVGDVIQQSKSRDLWRVTEVHDKVIDDVYQYFEARVQNMGASTRSAPSASSGHNVVVHGNVLGGIQVGSHGSVQKNNVQVSQIENDLSQLRELFASSSLPTLDKEEAALALTRVGELATRPKSPDILAKMSDKIDELKKLAAGVATLTTTASPLLIDLWDKIRAVL